MRPEVGRHVSNTVTAAHSFPAAFALPVYVAHPPFFRMFGGTTDPCILRYFLLVPQVADIPGMPIDHVRRTLALMLGNRQ